MKLPFGFFCAGVCAFITACGNPVSEAACRNKLSVEVLNEGAFHSYLEEYRILNSDRRPGGSFWLTTSNFEADYDIPRRGEELKSGIFSWTIRQKETGRLIAMIRNYRSVSQGLDVKSNIQFTHFIDLETIETKIIDD